MYNFSSLIVLWFVFKDFCFSHLPLPDVLSLSVHKHEQPLEGRKIVENRRFESLSRQKILKHGNQETAFTLSRVSVMTMIGQTI